MKPEAVAVTGEPLFALLSSDISAWQRVMKNLVSEFTRTRYLKS